MSSNDEARSSLHQLLQTDGQLSQPLAGRGEYGVAERGRNQGHPCFADAAGRLVAVDEMYINFGYLVIAKDPVVVEVGLLHPAADDRDFAPLGGRETEDDAAFDLRFDDARIDHLTAVDDADDFVHLEVAVDD